MTMFKIETKSDWVLARQPVKRYFRSLGLGPKTNKQLHTVKMQTLSVGGIKFLIYLFSFSTL